MSKRFITTLVLIFIVLFGVFAGDSTKIKILMYVGATNSSKLQPSMKVIKNMYETECNADVTYSNDLAVLEDTKLIEKYKLVFVAFPDDALSNKINTYASCLNAYAEAGGCLVFLGETNTNRYWSAGNEQVSNLSSAMGFTIRITDLENNDETGAEYVLETTNSDLLKNVSYLDGFYIPALELGNGENTVKNTTVIARFTKDSYADSIAIADVKVKNGYITFLTDINMWMGKDWTRETTIWMKCVDGGTSSDSMQFMKNLLTRSIDNIEAVTKMNKIFYTGLDNSHFQKDLDENEYTNPSAYTYTDTFTLNNPIKEGWIFTGWSGTGLVGNYNMTVTVPTGSTGDRYYTAHFSKHEHKWVYGLANDGKSLTAHCDGSDEYAYLCEYHDASNSLVLEIIPEYKKQLTATVNDGALVKTITWSSADESIATVDQNGLVTGLIPGGRTTIYATSNDGSNITASCAVTIAEQ